VENVKVDRLARSLNVTRGGFYWHFKNREDLLNALLTSWEQTNTEPLVRAAAEGATPEERFFAIGRVWIEEKGFSPAYDAAVRDWARTSAPVAALVRRVDERRIALLKDILSDFGLKQEEALIRARITYYHQVGYYAMGVHESKAERLRNAPLYFKVLTGSDMK